MFRLHKGDITMKEKLSKLIDVKSITTIVLVVIFAILSIKGSVTSDQFLTIFSVVIAFYFGTQVTKKNSEG